MVLYLQVFTPKQLKLIKQQQKLLDKLQKKTEREAERRRRSDARQRKREEGRRKGKKNKSVKVRKIGPHLLAPSLPLTPTPLCPLTLLDPHTSVPPHSP